MKWLLFFNDRLAKFYENIGSLVGIVIGLFAVAISVDLLLRLIGVGNLPGLQEIVEYLLYACVFIGAPWVLRVGGHTFVDVLLTNLPPLRQVQLQRALLAAGALISGILTYFGVINCIDAFYADAMQMKYFNVPEWWLLVIFIVSFSLLTLEFLLKLFIPLASPDPGSSELS